MCILFPHTTTPDIAGTAARADKSSSLAFLLLLLLSVELSFHNTGALELIRVLCGSLELTTNFTTVTNRAIFLSAKPHTHGKNTYAMEEGSC
jgi:hypothetical protein